MCLLLHLSLWIISFIDGHRFYSIIWVDLRFGLFIDWIIFKIMFIIIELQLHVWIQRQFWVAMFKLTSCIFCATPFDVLIVTTNWFDACFYCHKVCSFWNKFHMLWFIVYVYLMCINIDMITIWIFHQA